MPREVFADEIERFLETLDGVSSARVLTGPGGDISYVYVTTEGALDSRGLRHGVLAVLQSRFGIPIDDWRVRVTQLRAGVQPSEIPHFRVARVEETSSAADIAVTVKLQWTRGSDVRSATGQARGRGGTYRPRTLAAAAIAAVRDALDVPHAELTLDRVGVVTFLDRPVVLVAVSAGKPPHGSPAGEPETYVGAAFDDTASQAAGPAADETAEPAITAALDAVTRWLLRAAFVDDVPRFPRRERLEAMRHFVLDAAAPAAGPIPLRAPRREQSEAAAGFPDIVAGGGSAGTAEAGAGQGTASRIAPVQALPPRRLGEARNGQSRVDQAAPARESDVGSGGSQPGPRPRGSQTKGGTAMGLQHDTPDVGSGMRAARASGVEDGFYRSLVVERTPVHLRCRDGYEVPRAIVRDAGTYALLVETPDGLELFFKHAIISIRVLPKPAAQA